MRAPFAGIKEDETQGIVSTQFVVVFSEEYKGLNDFAGLLLRNARKGFWLSLGMRPEEIRDDASFQAISWRSLRFGDKGKW